MKQIIPNLTDPDIIRVFFGKGAKRYDYTVTHEEFDEIDGDGPGHYEGVAVEEHQVISWKAGLAACDNEGVDPESLEGYKMRLAFVGKEKEAYALWATLEAKRTEPILARWEETVKGCTLAPIVHIPAMFVLMREDDSPELTRLKEAICNCAVVRGGWVWVGQDHIDEEMLEATRALWRKTAPGWLKEPDGSPSPDNVIKNLIAHYVIAWHLGGNEVTDWTRPLSDTGKTVIVKPPKEIDTSCLKLYTNSKNR